MAGRLRPPTRSTRNDAQRPGRRAHAVAAHGRVPAGDGDHLDPIDFTEPYIRSSMMWVNDPAMVMSPYPGEEATETALTRGTVPHFLPRKSPLPGVNPNLTDRFGTPFEPRRGGAETMYPEYIATMRTFRKPTGRMPGATESER